MWNKKHRPFLVVLSSPSGAGKTTICRNVVRRDKNIVYSVSATTRPPRKNEVNRKSYIFLSESRFRSVPGVRRSLRLSLRHPESTGLEGISHRLRCYCRP